MPKKTNKVTPQHVLQETTKKNLQKVEQQIRRNDVNELRNVCIYEGLPNHGIRKRAWPILLGIDTNLVSNTTKISDYIKHHKDTDQVAKDVDRSLWKFTAGKASRTSRREQLSRIINAILSLHPDLHYFQGYHDIVSVFLMVTGSEDESFRMMERLSYNHIRFALNQTSESTIKLLSLLFPLLKLADPQLHHFIEESTVEPIFALSWILTWFSHGFDDLDIIARLFDFILASHPIIPLYFGVSIIIHFREKLMKEVDCEYTAVHSFLSKISIDLPFEDLIRKSMDLFEKFPPQRLISQVSSAKSSPIIYYPSNWVPKFLEESRKHGNQLISVLNPARGQSVIVFSVASAVMGVAAMLFVSVARIAVGG